MQIHAVVGLATRNRQNMLRAALGSVRALRVPEGVRLTVIVVENNDIPTCGRAVEESLGGIAHIYAHEPVIGIANARNRVAELARQSGADVLLFLDDDEQASPDWLSNLVAAWQQGRGLLIGGPVRIGFDWSGETAYRRFIQRAIAWHYEQRAGRWERRFARGEPALISTNNCLADMKLFTVHGLSYSPSFHTGSDKRFYKDACARRLPLGWVADAIVCEYWPRHRTSLRYNFHRACEQEKTRYGNRAAQGRTRYFIAKLFRHVAATVFLTLSLSWSGGKNVVMLIRTLGRIWGLISARMGAPSVLYRTTTGS